MRLKLGRIATLGVAAITAASPAASMATCKKRVPPSAGLLTVTDFTGTPKLGEPFMLSGYTTSKVNSCVKITGAIEQPRVGDGRSTDQEASVTFAQDWSSLSSQLGISASASVRGVGWGGSASAAKYRGLEESAESVYMVLTHRLEYKDVPTTPNAALVDEARDLLNRGDILAFRARCGDGFVSSVDDGARFYGVVEIKTTSRREREEVKAAFGVQFGKSRVDADYKSAMESVIGGRRVDIKILSRGGSIDPDANQVIGSPGLGSLLASAASFKADALKNAVPIRYTVQPYDGLLKNSARSGELHYAEGQLRQIGADFTVVEQNLIRAQRLTRYVTENPTLSRRDSCVAYAKDVDEFIRQLSEQLDTLGDAAAQCLPGTEPAASCLADECRAPRIRIPPLRALPSECLLRCDIPLSDKLSVVYPNSSSPSYRAQCPGLLPGAEYVVRASGSAIWRTWCAISKDATSGLQLGINAELKLGESPTRLTSSHNSSEPALFDTGVTRVTVPWDGLVEATVSLRNASAGNGLPQQCHLGFGDGTRLIVEPEPNPAK